jgi:outer membrane protein OmpA-like peptidoglycan-associated protein
MNLRTITAMAALGIALPTVSGVPSALAQNFVSQQQILLQLKKQPVIVEGQQGGQVQGTKKLRVQQEQVFVDPNANGNVRIVKKRAPQPDEQVVIVNPNLGGGKVKTFRAPQPEDNGRVVLEMRTPEPNGGANGGIVRKRTPQPEDNQQTIVQEMRAPEPNSSGKVAKKRAPAPDENNAKQIDVASSGGGEDDPVARGLDVRVGGKIAAQHQAEETGTRYAGYGRVDLAILFDYDSDRINPSSFRQLTALVDALNDPSLGGGRFVVAGHTDAVGSRGYNLDLSQRRANAVYRFLVEYGGIGHRRLVTEGYGEDLLKFPDAPESGQNRRVEIINLGADG